MRHTRRPIHRRMSASTIESLESRMLLDAAITGVVLDATNARPLEGIEILVTPSGSDAPVAQVTTDADGVFTTAPLSPGFYEVALDDGAVVDGTRYVSAGTEAMVLAGSSAAVTANINVCRAGKVSGHVYVGEGTDNPAFGAVVSVAGWFIEGATEYGYWATADTNGYYELYLPATDKAVYPIKAGYGHGYLVNVAEGLYSASKTGSAGPDFYLSSGAVIRGSVVTEHGAAVPNRVVLNPLVHTNSGEFQFSASATDESGRFQMDVPADTDVWVQLVSHGWSQFDAPEPHADDRYAWGYRWIGPFNLSPGQTLDLDLEQGYGPLVVYQCGTLSGSVVDIHGNPVIGAELVLTGTDAQGGSVQVESLDAGGLTDENGDFTIDLIPPGDYQLRIQMDGYLAYHAAERIYVAADSTTTVQIVMQPADEGFTVSGRIGNFAEVAPKNSAGQVLPFEKDVDWTSYDLPGMIEVFGFERNHVWRIADLLEYSGLFSSLETVEDGYAEDSMGASQDLPGTFEISLPAGAQVLSACRQNRFYNGGMSLLLGDPVEVTGYPQQEIDGVIVNIPIGTATVTGAISLPDGFTPGITNTNSAIVVLRDAVGGDTAMGRAVATSNAEGNYIMENVPAGTYYLLAVKEGLVAYISSTFAVAEGQTVTKNITFTYGATASGTVRDNLGDPVEGVRVTSAATGLSTLTAADGTYALTGLFADHDTLTASGLTFPRRQSLVDLTGGAATVDFAQSEPTASLTGYVTNGARLSDGFDNDQDGQTDEADELYVGGAAVTVYNTVTRQSVTVTTVAGLYSFANLEVGDYVIAATAEGMTAAQYPTSGVLTLAAGANDLTESPIELATAPPVFYIDHKLVGGSIVFHGYSPTALLAEPITTVSYNGGTAQTVQFNQMDARNYTLMFTPPAGTQQVVLTISENLNSPVIDGQPVTQTFTIDMIRDLFAYTEDGFDDAGGAAISFTADGDGTKVSIPPFGIETVSINYTFSALWVGDAQTGLKLEGCKYGAAGRSVGATHVAVTATYDLSLTAGGQGATAGFNTSRYPMVQMAFTPDLSLSHAEFLAALRVGYLDESVSPAAWVWNDAANSNPDSGISAIKIDWVSGLISFQTSHFSQFVAALEDADSVVIGEGGASKLIFVDGDGTAVTVSLSGGGSGTVRFSGTVDEIAGTTTRTVTGSNLYINSISLSGTGARSALKIRTRLGTTAGTTVGSITGQSVVGTISAPQVSLVGTGLKLTGDGYVAMLQLGDLLNSADIEIAGTAAKGVAITLGHVSGGSMLSLPSCPVGKLKIASTANSSGIVAASVDSLTVRGAFGSGLTLTSTNSRGLSLGKATIAGAITSSSMTLDGSLGSLTAAGWSVGSLTARDVASLQIRGACNAHFTINASDASTARYALGKARIAGGISNATWSVAGDVNLVSIAGAVNQWSLGDVENMRSLVLGNVARADVSIAGSLGSSRAVRWTAGSLKALSLGSFSVTGSKTVTGDCGADVLLSQAYSPNPRVQAAKKFRVAGTYSGQLRSSNHLGDVSLGAMDAAEVLAGVKPFTIMPEDSDDFQAGNQASITSIRLLSSGDNFFQSCISAWRIASATNLRVNPPGAAEFGLAADSIGLLTVSTDGSASVTKMRNLSDPGDSQTTDQFVIRIM